MAEVKNALLIFSKPPLPGLVKTRMTKAFGGPLNDKQAADFFKRCLFDVCEASMISLMELQRNADAAYEADPTINHQVYDFIVSTTPAERVEDMRETFDSIGPWPMEIKYMCDEGATFDDHFDYAMGKIFDEGYEHIVAISGDIPTMPRTHINQAFEWLQYFASQGQAGFVMAPCQECGTSLIGQSRNTPINNQGIYYNMDGRPALDGYVEKIVANDIPCAYFTPVADIDEMTDLAHAISCMRAIEQAAKYQPEQYVPRRTLAWVDFMGFKVSTPPNENHDPRDYFDNPDGTHTMKDNA